MSSLAKTHIARKPIPQNPTIRRLRPGVFEIEGRSATYTMIDGACSCPSACYRQNLPVRERCWHFGAILAWSRIHPAAADHRTIRESTEALGQVCRAAAEENDSRRDRPTLPVPEPPPLDSGEYEAVLPPRVGSAPAPRPTPGPTLPVPVPPALEPLAIPKAPAVPREIVPSEEEAEARWSAWDQMMAHIGE